MDNQIKCPECGKYKVKVEDKTFKMGLPILLFTLTGFCILLAVNVDGSGIVAALVGLVAGVFGFISTVNYGNTNFNMKHCLSCGYKWE